MDVGEQSRGEASVKRRGSETLEGLKLKNEKTMDPSEMSALD